MLFGCRVLKLNLEFSARWNSRFSSCSPPLQTPEFRFPHHCKYFQPFARPKKRKHLWIVIVIPSKALGENMRVLTCMMLSSETEQMTHGSLGFHEKSEILAVWPPWMNRSSGGPSSASSADCSSPILERSHTWRRRSVPEEAKMVSLWGDHCT